MFKIGEFSKLSLIPVKTLRYYHEIGLLAPDHVDTFTGYRYYSAVQLPRLNRILALKELGFSLDQIRPIVDNKLTPEQIRGMLMLKQAEVARSISAENARLRRIESRLRQIELEDKMPEYEVVIKQVEPLTVAAVRGIMPSYKEVGPLYQELFETIGRHGIAPAGPSLGIYYDEDYKESDVDIEAAVPVANAALDNDRVVIKELPAITAASVVRRGPWDDFSPAYQALMQWVQANNYRVIGCNREIYLQGPESGVAPEEYIVEIQFPVARN
jgi:effector-binding domain-containing protein